MFLSSVVPYELCDYYFNELKESKNNKRETLLELSSIISPTIMKNISKNYPQYTIMNLKSYDTKYLKDGSQFTTTLRSPSFSAPPYVCHSIVLLFGTSRKVIVNKSNIYNMNKGDVVICDNYGVSKDKNILTDTLCIYCYFEMK